MGVLGNGAGEEPAPLTAALKAPGALLVDQEQKSPEGREKIELCYTGLFGAM